jgi:hypothetical protein
LSLAQKKNVKIVFLMEAHEKFCSQKQEGLVKFVSCDSSTTSPGEEGKLNSLPQQQPKSALHLENLLVFGVFVSHEARARLKCESDFDGAFCASGGRLLTSGCWVFDGV